MGKTRVAILGGGVAAITAAYALTETDPLGEKFEITLYQLGWRLGGKTASGRNEQLGERIEEHGLHIWGGFYENAFTVLRSALKALGRPPGSPQATIEQAFVRQDQVFLVENYQDQWEPWPLWFQPDADTSIYPGRDDLLSPPDSVIPPLADLLARGVNALLYSFQYYAEQWPGDIQSDTARKLDAMPQPIRAFIAMQKPATNGHPLLSLAAHLITQVDPSKSSTHDPAQAALIAIALALLELVEERQNQPGGPTELRRYWVGLAFGLRIFGGLLINDCLKHGLHVLDQYDFREFLGQLAPLGEAQNFGAALYDYAFAYKDGETPLLSACSAVQGALRMFLTYKGGFFYKATAGMGDTIFTPLYQVLKQRGVTFKFFHQVTSLAPTADGFNIGTIAINKQVDLALGIAEYAPLREVNGLPCWPSTPRWAQLLDGENLAAAGVDFEDVLDPLPPPAEQIVLTYGQDFDKVILGISVGALKDLCAPLVAANVAWADMVENLATTRTQAFQLWLDYDLQNLGGPFVAPTIPPNPFWPILPPPFPVQPGPSWPATWGPEMGPILTGYLKPFDTYSDMTQLLSAEAWPQPGPNSVGYFCSVMRDDEAPNSQAAANARVMQNALDWMTADLPAIWTNFKQDGLIQWDMLHATDGSSGAARFNQQFWRANVNPSERYVLSLPNTLQHRMEPGQSGFDNLFLAGDWTKVPDVNAGCVEVAAMSGLMAASAVSGVDIPIVLSNTLYGQPPFVNFAGWIELPPPPSICRNASVYAWGLPASKDACQRFLDRSFNRVAGRRRFMPLLDTVFLNIVKSELLSIATPPFSMEGTMAETDIGLWMLAGCFDSDPSFPSSVGWVPAYLFVDNDYCSASGREIWGFPKFSARTSVPGEPGSSGPFSASAYAIPSFGPNSTPSWQEILSISGTNIVRSDMIGSSVDILKSLAKESQPSSLNALADAQTAHPFIPIAGGIPAPVFFLKQFRDANSIFEACYQQTLKGALTLNAFNGGGILKGDWQIELSQCDSLPFIRDLGLGSPINGKLIVTSQFAFWGLADFTVALAREFPGPFAIDGLTRS